MAKVFKRSGSDFFYGRFKVDGKEIWFSTKCTDRKQAQAVADGKAHAARGKVNTDDYFTGLVALLARLPQDDQDAKCVEYTHRLMQTTRGKVNTNDYFTGLTTLLTRLPEKDQDAKRHDYARQLMQGQSSTLPVADTWQAWLDSPMKGNPGKVTTRG
ncbi:MAG: hypothetical protein KKF10_06090, partial [Verrucomicrobia bacterium]|nr:hypothetical protein [Verrucomicrobiota bacterium]